MAKRFTDTKKWDDDWFIKLPPAMKCVWSYLCDECDGAGLIKISFEKISFLVKEEITRETFDLHFAERVHWYASDAVWIHGYINAQYKKLSPNNKAHRSIAKLALKAIDGLSLSPKAASVRNLLIDFIAISDEHQPSPGRASTEAQAGDIGKDIKEIGNRKKEKNKEEESENFENFVHVVEPSKPDGWHFDAPEAPHPIAKSILPENSSSAAFALSTVPPRAQLAWLEAYPDPPWIKQEILSCLAHLAIKRPKSPFSTFGSFMGNWLRNNWKERKPLAGKPLAKPIDLFADIPEGDAS